MDHIVSLLVRAFLVESAYATDPCQFVSGGCNPGGAQTWVMNIIIAVAGLFVGFAGALAVLFILIGGFQMMTAFGDEGNFSKGYKNIMTSVVGLAVVLGSQVLVAFIDSLATPVGSQTTIVSIGLTLISRAVFGLLLLFNTVFVIILIGLGLRMVIARGKQDEFSNAKQGVGFALAGAIVINAAYAIARAALATFS